MAYVRELIDHALGMPGGERTDWKQRAREDNEEHEFKQDDRWIGTPDIPPEYDAPLSEPQDRPLENYAGTYHNVGYHGAVVKVRDGRLFIDASDRTMGVCSSLEHFRDLARYITHLEDCHAGAKGKFTVVFAWEEGGERAVRMGVYSEVGLRWIWSGSREEK